ncbi:MAG TPA: hypothetical protein VMU80_01825 [Bryobacteraceae bacterium]|nr:hypothetical protein [Bryobacteraceae bacterium]
MVRIGALAAAILAVSLYAGDSNPDSMVPVSVLVTARAHSNTPAPQVTPEDVLVSQNKQRLPVTALSPRHGEKALELWILIDDGSASSFGTQLADLKHFVLAQSPATQIGIGYMQNGRVEKVQPLTADHALAAKAIRLPLTMPGISASPYTALTELVKHWPEGAAAREVLMVSSGIDPLYGNGPDDPYLESAIDTVQRAGVVVYTIYYSGAGLFGHAYWELFWGQHNLAELSDDTGGKMYWLGFENPPSIAPYLNDLDQRLSGQYLLTFLAKPESKPGLQSVKIKTELPNVTLTGPSKVYVPAGE